MSLKLSDWADIAQIVSGIAVLITLVFLIFEIRESTSVTRASVFERSADRLIELRNQTLSDPEIARLFQAWVDSDNEGITRIDSIRQRQLVLNIFQIYEQAYFAEQYGLLGPTEWGRFERQICASYLRVPSFTEVMAETCRE